MHEMIFYKRVRIGVPDLEIKGSKGKWNCTYRSEYRPYIDPCEEEDFNTCMFKIGNNELDIAVTDRVYGDGSVDVYTFINGWKCDNDMCWTISVDNIDEELQKIAKWIDKMWNKLLM